MRNLVIALSILLFVAGCKKAEEVAVAQPIAPKVEPETYSFVEGEHYTVLDLPLAEGKVWEVYSVYCPFCAAFNDTVVPAIEGMLPEDSLETIYFANYGSYGHELAQVLAVMKAQGEDKYRFVKDFYFDEIVAKRSRNINPDGSAHIVAMGLEVAGMSQKDFEAALATTEVKDILSRWERLSMAVVKVSGGIPALVVKGKYLIALDKVSSEQMMMAEIKYLLEK